MNVIAGKSSTSVGLGAMARCPSASAAGFGIRSRRSRCSARGLRRKLRHTVLGRDLISNRCSSRISIARSIRAPAARTICAIGTRGRDDSALARTLYADQKTYLVELLMKQDQMSMAASIESRVPFLDHTLVEFAARIPDGLKIRGRTQKYILKAAMRDLLPRAIVHRKKMGFPTPLASGC